MPLIRHHCSWLAAHLRVKALRKVWTPSAVAHEVHWLGPSRPLEDLVGRVPPLQATHWVMPVRGAYRLLVHGAHWVAVAGVRVAVEVAGLVASPLHEEAVPTGQGTTWDWASTPAPDSSM